MRHVLYTEPSAPQAGQEMTVYYNPSDTCLTGITEVYITVRLLACPPVSSALRVHPTCQPRHGWHETIHKVCNTAKHNPSRVALLEALLRGS